MRSYLKKRILLVAIWLGVAAAAIYMRPALAQEGLPNGPGKEDVVAHCIGCHDSDKILSHRMTADQWSYTVNSMIGLGAVVPDPDKIVGYLTTNFGPPAAAPVIATPSTADIPAASPVPASPDAAPPGVGAPAQ
jgi:hypothetical protein